MKKIKMLTWSNMWAGQGMKKKEKKNDFNKTRKQGSMGMNSARHGLQLRGMVLG